MSGQARQGLRIRGDRGHPVVRRALVRYARWLRLRVEFPIRVPVYLSPQTKVTTIHGNAVSASFFAPWDATVEPYIRIATGDYASLRATRGRNDALAAYIVSLSHEVIHYRQWVETGETRERGVAQKATWMLRAYEKTALKP